jgi:hypothetical protein
MGEIIQFRGRGNGYGDTVPFAYTDSKVELSLLTTQKSVEHVRLDQFVLFGLATEDGEKVIATKCDPETFINGLTQLIYSLKRTGFTANERQELRDQLQIVKVAIDNVLVDLSEWS